MKRQAFTLVELLCVIVIIGVLVLIVVPVTATARAASRNSRCQANLRILAQGAQLWIADHNRHMPDANLWQATGGDYSLRAYLGISSAELDQQAVFTCPEAYRLHPDPENGLTDNLRTYSINLYACRTQNGSVTSDVAGNAPVLAALPYPSKTSLFMDGDLITAASSVRRFVHSGMAAPGGAWTESKPYGLLAVHSGKVNVAFVDGHVGQVAFENIPNSTSEGGVTKAQKHPFWGRYPQ